jgi:1,2-phenylacetyl-CoA epoxidase catalytic subunit
MVEQLQQNDQAQVASVTGLVFEDNEHNTHTLQSLNMMRKNRHFCDVILHVSTKCYITVVLSSFLHDTHTQQQTEITVTCSLGFS